MWINTSYDENFYSCESLDTNSENIVGFYKGDNFITDIAFGAKKHLSKIFNFT